MAKLKKRAQQCIDFEDTYEILPEWEKWDILVQDGYEAQEDRNYSDMAVSYTHLRAHET